MKKPLHTLTVCLALALIAQGAAASTLSHADFLSPGSLHETGADVVVLPPASLDAVTGTVNWRKVSCWTGVVGVAVGASLVGSPGFGAGASAALAVVCLALH